MDFSSKMPGANFTYGEYARWWEWRNRQSRGGKGLGPIHLTIAFTSTQFVFKLKLPITKSVTFVWGDGTTENVTGQGAVLITKTSSYSGAGTYTFYLTGDVSDITYIDVRNQAFISGDISGWSALTNITNIYAYTTGLSGDISSWSTLVNAVDVRLQLTSVSGDISSWSTLVSATTIILAGTSVSGDVSTWSVLTGLKSVDVYTTSITFDNTPAWGNTGATLNFQSNSWTSTMVNNALASFAATPLTGCAINIAGTNANRTSASDADKAIIIDVGNSNTLTVNE